VKLENKKLKIGILLIAVLLASLSAYVYWGNAGPKSTISAEANQDLALMRPTFSPDATIMATFLSQEAGIAIWLNRTDQAPLDLNAAKNGMVNVENATSEYVIGSLKFTPNQYWTVPISSDDYPHCFVHKSGWIVVYYLKVNTQNTGTTGYLGKIIDWPYYTNTGKLDSNLLSEGMSYMAYTTLLKSTTGEQYFHFQYPSATKLMFAVKHAPNGSQQSFNIKIPSTSTMSEESWSCYSTGYGGYTFKIDSTQVSAGSGRNYGDIPDDLLSADYWHTIYIICGYNYYGSDAYVCLILLYA
jgi:hypothetical protein